MWCPIATSILAVVVAIVAAIVAALKWRYKYYWQSQQVPHIPATFPGGNINLLHLEESISIVFKKWYNEFKSKGHKYGGTFVLTSPILTIVDLELIKMILLKDFSNFMDRGFYYNDKDDPLSGNLLNLEGQRWRTLRNKLSPTFTSGKLKMMFPILVECSSRLDDPITLAVENKEPIDAKDVFIRFTTDVIGSCIFGIDCNSFKNKENPFALYAKKIFEPTLIENLRSLLIFGCPSLARFFRMRVTPPDVAKFFWKLTDDAVTHRENNNITRNDFLQLLIDMKNDTKGGDTLTMGEIAAQGFIFFLGGYETSSTTGSFCLYELSVHQDVQRKLRKEIEEVLEKHEGKITYEAMQQMTYMEQVINETLRKYPPISNLNRVCLKDYLIPGSDYVIKQGTSISISTLGLQYDPEYFPNPEKFDPDRFSEENKKNMVSYTFLPFGDGPRICIGSRFAMLQLKVGLTVMLRNYRFSLSSKTKTPIEMVPESFTPSVKGGLWINVDKLQ